MTDEQIDRMVRQADPVPEAGRLAGRLDGAEQHLLEEIMSEPQPRRGVFRRATFTLAAAAVLITVVAVSLAFRSQPSHPAAIVPPAAVPERKAQAMTPAAWMKLAENSPRLLIDAPGWKVTNAYGFADQNGTLAFANNKQTFEMNWYPAKDYQGYRTDRDHVSAPRPATVDGWPGKTVTYSDNDFATMLEPRKGVFVEVRAQGVAGRAAYEELLTRVKQVDVKTWLAALPPEIVTPDKAPAAAAKLLADIPLPPGFDPKKIAYEGTNDPYQFGARVTSEVGCRWIEEWDRARTAGDKNARDRAAAALKGSHHWKVLNDMNALGDWPEVFWDYSDKIAGGELPRDYKAGLGCGTTW
ncbi:hypothetical protein [Actinoplanes sp. NPDC049265]|uniref:hypothetical protein n=1 Tax=Actinoplanes sp. NPDC049265 TaxID=3363902 RepID=UPI003723CEAD